MEKKKAVRKGKRVAINFRTDEYQRLHEQFRGSACVSFSEYVRTILANRRIIFKKRNESIEQFLETAIDLKNDLHTAVSSEASPVLAGKVEEILLLMRKIYKECKLI